MGAIVVTWVPLCLGATKVTLGGIKVTCGCQWGHEGATVSGCHQGHVWVSPSVGATKVMFGWH